MIFRFVQKNIISKMINVNKKSIVNLFLLYNFPYLIQISYNKIIKYIIYSVLHYKILYYFKLS